MPILKVFSHESLDSTQSEAWRLVEANTPKPFFVKTKEQTLGRGRMDRKWEGNKEASLFVSLVCEFEVARLQALSLGVGLFVAKYFSTLPIQLKWPNDLMLYDSKVGGILIESRIHGSKAEVVIGIGINKKSIPNTPYQGLEVEIDTDDFIDFVYEGILDFQTNSFSKFQADYEKRLWRNQQKITYLIGNDKKEVVIRGVDGSGQLLIEDNRILEVRATGEIALV